LGLTFFPHLASGAFDVIAPLSARLSPRPRSLAYPLASSLFCVCLALALGPGPLMAQDPAPSRPKTAATKQKDDQVKALIKQLGSNKDDEHEAAAKKLRAAGPAIIPELGDAAQAINKRAKEAAIEILTGYLKSNEAETRIAAYQQLREVATGQRSAISVKTSEMLKEYPEVRAEFEAELKARSARRKELAAQDPAAGKPSPPQPKPPIADDPLASMRRKVIEQSIKEAELSSDKIKKLKLPKDLEAQQLSAINQTLQNLRNQLQALDRPMRKK
jgi:hypothetical protein